MTICSQFAFTAVVAAERRRGGVPGVFAFTAGAFIWGYFEYVAKPSVPPPPPPSAATVLRRDRLAACATKGVDVGLCEQEALDSTAAALEQERLLDRCLDDAFGGSEKRACQFKYRGIAGVVGLP